MASTKPTPTLERLDQGLGIMKKYGTGPDPQDPYLKARWDMSNVHALLLNSLIHIYRVSSHRDHISKQLLTDFDPTDRTVGQTSRLQ